MGTAIKLFLVHRVFNSSGLDQAGKIEHLQSAPDFYTIAIYMVVSLIVGLLIVPISNLSSEPNGKGRIDISLSIFFWLGSATVFFAALGFPEFVYLAIGFVGIGLFVYWCCGGERFKYIKKIEGGKDDHRKGVS